MHAVVAAEGDGAVAGLHPVAHPRPVGLAPGEVGSRAIPADRLGPHRGLPRAGQAKVADGALGAGAGVHLDLGEGTQRGGQGVAGQTGDVVGVDERRDSTLGPMLSSISASGTRSMSSPAARSASADRLPARFLDGGSSAAVVSSSLLAFWSSAASPLSADSGLGVSFFGRSGSTITAGCRLIGSGGVDSAVGAGAIASTFRRDAGACRRTFTASSRRVRPSKSSAAREAPVAPSRATSRSRQPPVVDDAPPHDGCRLQLARQRHVLGAGHGQHGAPLLQRLVDLGERQQSQFAWEHLNQDLLHLLGGRALQRQECHPGGTALGSGRLHQGQGQRQQAREDDLPSQGYYCTTGGGGLIQSLRH